MYPVRYLQIETRSRFAHERVRNREGTPSMMSRIALSNKVREHMLSHKMAAVCLLLDALYSLHCTIGGVYTVDEILTITQPYGISERLIRSALKSLLFRRGVRYGSGRPAITYRLPSPRQVRDWYMLYDASENSDVLPPAAFASIHHYKKHMHAAMLARLTVLNRGEFKLSRAFMAKRLNVTADTVRNYERDFAIDVIPHITQTLVNSVTAWDLPPVNKNDHSQYLYIVRPDGSHRRYPLVRAIAVQAISTGCDVFHMRQHINYYRFERDYLHYVEPHLLPVATHPTDGLIC